MKIAVYGGSFDPPHLAHKEIAKTILNKLEIDKLLIIPNAKNSYKELKTDPHHRMNMLKLLFENDKNINIEDYEIKNKDKYSYTYKTLLYLKDKYKDLKRLYLVIGLDQAITFKTWDKYQLILNLADLIVINRYLKEDVVLNFKYRMLDFNFNISSSLIRDKIKNRKNFDDLIDKKVYFYIKENKLYL